MERARALLEEEGVKEDFQFACSKKHMLDLGYTEKELDNLPLDVTLA